MVQVPYTRVLEGTPLPELVRAGDIVRFESTGGDLEQEACLLELGSEGAATEGRRRDLAGGEIPPLPALHEGLTRALARVRTQRAACPPHRATSHEDDVLAMCDKRVARGLLEAAGVPTPELIGPVRSASELQEEMRARRFAAAFLKPAHGSGGSATIALRLGFRGRAIAYTTVDRVAHRGGVRHFNCRPLRRLESWPEIRTLVDELVPQQLVAERWMPKIGAGGRTLDVRVVVIAGTARQVLPRLGRGPVTNLHLRNMRGNVETVTETLGEPTIREVRELAERASRCWPSSLYVGVDVLVTASRRLFVAEVNAFGDWHEGVHVDGRDTYAFEWEALERARQAA